jgi:ABC-type transport system involved in cytochrome c biogenesis permease subunit
MMLALFILGLVVIAGSIWADYKWRKWLADRRRDHE